MGDQNEWSFYHALYMLVAHCAGYIAMLVLLINIGLVLSISTGPPKGVRFWFCAVAAIFAVLGSFLFSWRAHTYSSIVNGMLPPTYLQPLLKVGARPSIFLVAAFAVLVLAALILTSLFLSK